MMDELGTYAENTWCPGCGNFGILNAFKKAVRQLESQGVPKNRLFISTGIGCHGKIFDYLSINGFYSLHGREMATIEGAKLANPELVAIAFGGDGDAFGEGISHLLFAAKRNFDMTMIVHDNGVYGLTTGQYAPTSPRNFHGPSTPKGSVEEPIDPLSLMLVAGATFVARGYSGRLEELADLMVRAVNHRGFAFIDVLQPCVTYNNTYKKYNSLVEPVQHDPAAFDAALSAARRRDRVPVGLFYEVERPQYHKELMGEWNPVRDHLSRPERLARVDRALNRELNIARQRPSERRER